MDACAWRLDGHGSLSRLPSLYQSGSRALGPPGTAGVLAGPTSPGEVPGTYPRSLGAPRHPAAGGADAPHLPGAGRLPGDRHADLRRVRAPAARALRGDPESLRGRAARVSARHLRAGPGKPRSGPTSTSKRRRRPWERPAIAWCGPSTTWPSRHCWKSAPRACATPYRWLRPPEDLDALASSLHQRTLERETREIARLDEVLTLAAHDGCQTAFLAAHFGEQLPGPCGHCSWCENGGQPAKLLPPAPVHLS